MAEVMKGACSMTLAALPPGPEGHHIIGNDLDFKRDPLGFLTRCAREYGDIVRLTFPGRPTYLLNHPDYIEYVLVKQNRNFTKNRSRFLRRFRQEMMIIGNSLLASEGEFWRRQRRLSQPAFHRHHINAYGEVMVACTERMLANWRDGETYDIHQEMARLLLEIVAKTVLSTDDDTTKEVEKAYGRIEETLGGPGLGIQVQEGSYGILLQFLRYLRFLSALRRLDKITYGIINERRSSSTDTGDLLSMLLHFQDEEGNRMSDKQLRDEVVGMFFAGYETTANALSWTWYLLSQHPKRETRLLRELQEVLGKRVPTVEDLPRLRYTDMVIKESMRLYPPAWNISRIAIEECEIGGYRVLAGTRLLMSQWVMHRDPRFFENPEVFDPERWGDGFAERTPKYAYFPFGGGPRQCIGNSFAMMQATVVLATIAQRYRPKLVPGQRVIPQPSITLRPAGGMKMLLKKRPPTYSCK
jgi:cytochrome P450